MKNFKHLFIGFLAVFTITSCFTSCSKDDVPIITRATLTYNTNGASSGTMPIAITQETGTNLLLDNGTVFSRNGFTFVGWNTNASGTGTNYTGGSSYTLANDAILYANWTAVATTQ